MKSMVRAASSLGLGAFFFLFSSVAFATAAVDVVIIGAGLSGLATAYHLKKAGKTYRILELTPRVGGRVRTVSYQFPGQKPTFADSGMEEYWESNPAVKILKDLKLPVSHDFAASSIALEGKLHAFEDETSSDQFLKRVFTEEERLALENFKKETAPIIHQLVPGKVPADILKLKDVSFAEWVQAKKLPTKVSEWIRVSIECEAGTTWDKFAAIEGLKEFHIFLGKGEESFRVIGGNERFTNALAAAVGKNNILLNKRVTRVITSKRGDSVSVSYLDQSSHKNETVVAKHVVSTIPIFRAPLEIQFEPSISEKKRAAMMTQTWGSYFKAHVFVSSTIGRKFWEPKGNTMLPVLSDSNLGVIYDGNRDQNASTKIISLLVFGPDAERFNMMPLDQIRPVLSASFEKLWPGFAKEIRGMEFYRFHPRAVAGWPVGRSRFDELSDEMRRPENRVYFAGDFTESTHSDGAFHSAERVVNQILNEEATSRKIAGGK